jgi:hypothetical protein
MAGKSIQERYRTAGAGKAMRKDAAFQIPGQRLAHKGFGTVVASFETEVTDSGLYYAVL